MPHTSEQETDGKVSEQRVTERAQATALAPKGAGQDLADSGPSSARSAIGRKVPSWVKVAIVVALFAVASFSLTLGKYPVPIDQIVPTLFAYLYNSLSDLLSMVGLDSMGQLPIDEVYASALINVRIPRIVIVMLVGAALSVAGASYQGMFKNPLVSPDVLGASAGASFGACLAMLWDLPAFYISLFAFIGACVAVGCAVWVNKAVNRYDALLGLVLGGMLVSTLFQAFVSLIKFMADANDKLPSITYWLMGSFSRTTNEDMAIFWPMLIGFVVLLLERWKLNVMSFGEKEAKSLGVNVGRVRLIVITASTLLVGCSVAVSGIVGWVGLVIPHLARAIVGPNYKALLPASMLIGAAYLLVVDDFCRMVATVDIPIGILTAIIGVPFFIFIFKRNTKGW